MVIESLQRGNYELIRILDDVTLNTDLSKLFGIVEKNLSRSRINIAISFTNGSFLYTHHIAILIKCLELIRDNHGTMSVVKPSKDIDDVLALIDPEGIIRRFENEDGITADGSLPTGKS